MIITFFPQMLVGSLFYYFIIVVIIITNTIYGTYYVPGTTGLYMYVSI